MRCSASRPFFVVINLMDKNNLQNGIVPVAQDEPYVAPFAFEYPINLEDDLS